MPPFNRKAIAFSAATAILLIICLAHNAWADKHKIKVISEKA
jgi:hypothetical protein